MTTAQTQRTDGWAGAPPTQGVSPETDFSPPSLPVIPRDATVSRLRRGDCGMGRLHREERKDSRESQEEEQGEVREDMATVQHSPLATRPLGAPSRLGFQRTLRRSVAAAGKNAMIVASRRA
eukprot:347216-Pyramimonas_sp.AAC.1